MLVEWVLTWLTFLERVLVDLVFGLTVIETVVCLVFEAADVLFARLFTDEFVERCFLEGDEGGGEKCGSEIFEA